MKLLIEVPSWLGDAIMVTPAIENISTYIDNLKITLIGSNTSIEALKYHPKIDQTFVIDKKFSNFYNTLKNLERFDLFVSFRGSFRSKFMKIFISANSKHQFDKNKYKTGHQVERYNNFVCEVLKIDKASNKLSLHIEKQLKNDKNKILGISPGASYGSAKRWYPKEFAEVAYELSTKYDIVIFGGNNEKDIAAEIENYLIQYGVYNYQNLAGQTSVKELINHISSLDLFVTGDSGPMHIAAVFEIPTVAIFGPTNDKETSQWMNPNGLVVKKSLGCQPCMKRACPLKHHECMKKVNASEVLKALKSLI